MQKIFDCCQKNITPNILSAGKNSIWRISRISEHEITIALYGGQQTVIQTGGKVTPTSLNFAM